MVRPEPLIATSTTCLLTSARPNQLPGQVSTVLSALPFTSRWGLGRCRAECTLPAASHEGRAGAPQSGAASFTLFCVPPLTLKGIFLHFRYAGPPPCIPALYSPNHTPPKNPAKTNSDYQGPPCGRHKQHSSRTPAPAWGWCGTFPGLLLTHQSSR